MYKSEYDDDDIPQVDLPQSKNTTGPSKETEHPDITEPLPETSRPRKDGPGGN